MVEMHDFPRCCGAKILAAFGYGFDTKLTSTLRAHHAQATNNETGLLLAITSPMQPHAEKLLKAKGFKATTTFINPSTDRKLTLWTKKINQPTPRKAARR